MRRILVFTVMFALLAAASALGVGASESAETGAARLPLEDVTLTVVYDNNPGRSGLKAEWGFACVIEGYEKRILFDTGASATSLLANMESLSIDPGSIDLVVLSHGHGDHTGGVRKFVGMNPDVTVYLPEVFSTGFKQELSDSGATVVEVGDAVEILPGVHSTGQMGGFLKEQALVLHTDRGLIMVTGCAHPGIVAMIGRAREITGREVLLAMGGFHLVATEGDALSEVVAGFREAGVRCAAPCHCSGDQAREAFSEAYGDKYVELSVGSVVRGSDFK